MSSLFSFSGRTSRLPYNVQVIILFFLQLAAYVLMTGSLLPSTSEHSAQSVVIYLVFVLLCAPVTIRRLHDLSLESWVYWAMTAAYLPLMWMEEPATGSKWALLQTLYCLGLAVVGLILSLALSFKKGSAAANKHGASPV